jgi:hypothetical protein
MEVFMELEALKKWYKQACETAEWYNDTDVRCAISHKESKKKEYEDSIAQADKVLGYYQELLDKKAFLLELIKAQDPEFEGISDEKEGE